MNDELKDRLTRLAGDARPETPDVPALVKRGRRRRTVLRAGQGAAVLAMVLAVALPLYALRPLRPGSPVPRTSPTMVVDFGAARAGGMGAHGGVRVSYAGVTVIPGPDNVAGVVPSFSALMAPPGTPITFTGDSAGGSVRFAEFNTGAISSRAADKVPSAPGGYAMTVSTGWVSATGGITIVKPTFSTYLTVGSVPPPPSLAQVQITPASFGPPGAQSIALTYGGQEIEPAALQTSPVTAREPFKPHLMSVNGSVPTLAVPVGTRFTVSGGGVVGGQLRSWAGATGGVSTPRPVVGASFDLAHGSLAVIPGQYELTMGVRALNNPRVWVTFTIEVVSDQVTPFPGGSREPLHEGAFVGEFASTLASIKYATLTPHLTLGYPYAAIDLMMTHRGLGMDNLHVSGVPTKVASFPADVSSACVATCVAHAPTWVVTMAGRSQGTAVHGQLLVQSSGSPSRWFVNFFGYVPAAP